MVELDRISGEKKKKSVNIYSLKLFCKSICFDETTGAKIFLCLVQNLK